MSETTPQQPPPPKLGDRMYNQGKTMTIYVTGFFIVLALLVLFFPLGIIAFLAWMYIIHKHRQGKRA
jgi:hypothetical protein